MELVNGHESCFVWRSAIVLLSQSLMPASNVRWRLIWLQESHGQQCVWNKEHLDQFFVFSAVIGVFAGLMSASVRMHWKSASRSRRVKDVVSWHRRWAVSRNERFRISSRSVRARSRALHSIAPEAVLGCSCSDEDEVSFARRESREDFPEVILSDNLALVLAICK